MHRDLCTAGMTIKQSPMSGIFHNEIRDRHFYTKIQHPQNMAMFQRGNSLCFLKKGGAKSLHLHSFYLLQQELNGSLRFEVDMFTQVDLPKSPLSKPTKKSIVAKLLSNTI